MPELSLETLAKKFDDVTATIKSWTANEEEKKKHDMEAKKAEDEKHEDERKEAKKGRRAKKYSAIKRAMEEDDEDKKDAALKKAMEEDEDEHMAEHEEMKKHDAMEDDEKKEHDAQIASIINKEKLIIDASILRAAKIMNPAGVDALAKELKSNKFTASKKMQEDMSKIWGSEIFDVVQTASVPKETAAPYFMAAAMSPQEVDASQLNANSPDSEFAKLTTKELLEMTQ